MLKLKFTLIDDAWSQFSKLWSIRVLLLSSVVSSIAGCLFLFQNWLSPLLYVGINIGFNILAIILRLIAQKTEDVNFNGSSK